MINSKENKEIYMDYAAGVNPNPGSIHRLGVSAKNILEESRNRVAKILNSHKDEIIFTGGGTESNNLAIQGLVFSYLEKQNTLPHIITTNIEHPSVLETFRLLAKRSLAKIDIIPVESNGILNTEKLAKKIKRNTILISVMYVNNEIGTIQPIRDLAKIVRFYKKKQKRADLYLHTDAVQAVNYLDINVEKLGVDLLSISGTKIEGTGRVGVLYKKRNVNLAPILGGGEQEFGLRPGTENLAEIVKFTKAFLLVNKNKEKENKRLIKLRDYFVKKLLKFDCVINGDLENRIQNNTNVTFPKIPSDLLVLELSAKGIMASSKSACKSSSKEGSYVIEAIRPDMDSSIGGIRFSFGKKTTKDDLDYLLKTLTKILLKYKKWYNS